MEGGGPCYSRVSGTNTAVTGGHHGNQGLESQSLHSLPGSNRLHSLPMSDSLC